MANFAHNNAINRSNGKSPFEIVQDFTFCQSINLMPIPLTCHISESVESFANHIHELHYVIRCKLVLNNELYKLSINNTTSYT